MAETFRHDAWQAGDNYDLYMGRWSRQVAPRFIEWLNPRDGLDWFEVGCGTGALSAAIVAQCNPASLLAIDPSEAFVAKARANVPDHRAVFQVGDAQALSAETESIDVIASALVLNFVPDKNKALSEMKRIARNGATIGFYVWDYPGGGVEFMHAFWQAAITIDPAAIDLAEDRRFSHCVPEALTELAMESGLTSVECVPIEVPTVFKDIDDYWHPFTLGAGPAPGYCASLNPDARERLRAILHERLPRQENGTISLKARAWAVKGSAI